MKKDAFYFPHYSNARNDRKLKRVIKDLGIEGYAIYFMILEVLRDQPNFKYPIKDIDLLADEFGTTDAKLRVVISNYELFTVDTNQDFFSIKQIQYLQPYIEKSQRARDAANKRWNDANAYANALQIESASNASKVKESKVKESKVDEKIPIPDYSEFLKYALEKHPNVDATLLKLKYDAWVENGWKDGHDNKIKKWKSKLLQTLPHLTKQNTTPQQPQIKLPEF